MLLTQCHRSSVFEGWAVYAHKDDTGFGRMARDVRAVLGLGQHLVIPSERLLDHPVDGINERWLPGDASPNLVRSLLSGLDGILFFERATWHPYILRMAREMGVATVCVPMWEWFKGDAPEWKLVDLFVCPTRQTEKVVQSYGFRNTVVIPWALDLARLPRRQILGPARHFIHNAGLVDHDDRKGTRDTIRAFTKVTRPDIRLTVRMQKPVSLPPLDDRITLEVGNLPDPAGLYSVGDVCIQPSKMEGLGFMVLEPVAAGLPVITTDYPPMNEFVRQAEMRCGARWFKRRAFASHWIKQAHLKLPNIKNLARVIGWAAAHDLNAISSGNREWAEETFSPERLRQIWCSTLLSVLKPVSGCSSVVANHEG
jgi:glycosyltransferase involved in cell wall biosynthesis